MAGVDLGLSAMLPWDDMWLRLVKLYIMAGVDLGLSAMLSWGDM